MNEKDILGTAIYAHFMDRSRAKLYIHNTYGDKEVMPVETYFRAPGEMPGLELLAIQACKGKVLEVGAGAGSHSLLLQNMGIDVTALEISALACETMKLRGVKKVIVKDFFKFSTTRRYQTILLLMNGIGLCQTLDGFETFLSIAYQILEPGGQLLFDSSDIAYLDQSRIANDRYYGELHYRYEYKKKFSNWFSWLYIDKQTLNGVLDKKHWKMQILFESQDAHYLVRLIRKKN